MINANGLKVLRGKGRIAEENNSPKLFVWAYAKYVYDCRLIFKRCAI